MTPFPRCEKYGAFENAYPFCKLAAEPGSGSIERRPILCTRRDAGNKSTATSAPCGGRWRAWSPPLGELVSEIE